MSRSSIDGVGMLMRRVTQSSFATAIAFAESEFELFLQVHAVVTANDSVIPITATIPTVHRVAVARVPRRVVLGLLKSQRKSGNRSVRVKDRQMVMGPDGKMVEKEEANYKVTGALGKDKNTGVMYNGVLLKVRVAVAVDCSGRNPQMPLSRP